MNFEEQLPISSSKEQLPISEIPKSSDSKSSDSKSSDPDSDPEISEEMQKEVTKIRKAMEIYGFICDLVNAAFEVEAEANVDETAVEATDETVEATDETAVEATNETAVETTDETVVEANVDETAVEADDSDMKLMAMSFLTCEAYNDMYKHIILNDDDALTKAIKNLAGRHSVSCFLTLIHYLHQKLMKSIWHPKITTREMYWSFGRKEYKYVNKIAKAMEHECPHMTIESEDPNKPLISYSVEYSE